MGTLNSPNMANYTASPPVHVPAGLGSGKERIYTGKFEIAVGDLDAADIIMLDRIPTNERVVAIEIYHDDLGTTLTVDCGLYNTDGSVKDVDLFATAASLATANITGAPTDLTWEVLDPTANMGLRLWEMAGDTEDPGGHYDVALTVVSSSAPAAGGLAYRIKTIRE